MHGRVVDQHVRQLDIRILLAHLFGDIAPELGALEHVHLVDRADLPAAFACGFESNAQDAANLAFRVVHGIEAETFAIPDFDAARLAEVDVAGQFAHDENIEAGHHFGFERRGIGKFGIKNRRTQVGEQAEILADAQQAAFGPQLARVIVPLRTTDSAEQHGIGLLGKLLRRRWKRIFRRVDGTAAELRLFHLEFQIERLEHAHRLGGNFRADAIAGKNANLHVEFLTKNRMRHQWLTKRHLPAKVDQSA